MAASKIILISALLLLSSCAHTAKGKVYQNMLLAGASGALLGQQRADFKNTHSTMYAGIGAAIAAAVTIYLEDPDKEVQKLRDELRLLRAQENAFNEPKLTSSTAATFGAKVPDRYKKMINPGEWRIYEVDQWVEDGENRLLHQDRVMELIPPSLNPGGR